MPSRCRPGCSLEAIDELLVTAGALTGQEADSLLDLRQLLRARTDAQAALLVFCQLRQRLEKRHYLVFYRLRRWLENHIVAEFRASPKATPTTLPIHLSVSSPEAIRRLCLCAALHKGQRAQADPKSTLTFSFVPLPAPSAGA